MPWDLQTLLASDNLIPCLVLLSLSILSLRIFPHVPSARFPKSIVISPRNHGTPLSPKRALAAFASYRALAEWEMAQMRRSYERLGRVHKRIGYGLGYISKLRKLGEVTDVNARITSAVVQFASSSQTDAVYDSTYVGITSDGGDLSRVRETLKHFVRDWSLEGADERDKIFGLILDVLRRVEPRRREELRVLIPGCGLGRLAWEVSELGFDVTANELSAYMTTAFRFLLSPSSTPKPFQHIIHPYAHWFSHQRENASLFRAVSFPDVLPRLSSTFRLLENDFLLLKPPPARESQGRKEGGYDYIITLFFIDTSLNIIATLQQIHNLLAPGGTWINLGPLLYTPNHQASLELSLEEVMKLVDLVGFDIVDEERKEGVECEYTRDNGAMMRWIYKAEFWVARKRVV